MKIVIIDFGKSHHEYIETQLKIFRKDDVSIVTSDFMKENINKDIAMSPNFSWKTKDGTRNAIEIFDLIKLLNKTRPDYVFINTLQNDWFKYAVIALSIYKSIKIVLTIHNINSYFERPVIFSIKNYYKLFLKILVFKRANIYNVYGEKLKQYLKTKVKKKEILTIPFQLCDLDEHVLKKQSDNSFKIVVPGTVNMRRRDYTMIENLLEYDDISTSNIEIILLGRPREEAGKNFVERNSENKKLKVYMEFVTSEEFHYQMSNADIILAPLIENIRFDGVTEYYGLSKEGGASFLAIKYQLPLIIPKYIEPMTEIESSTIQYEDVLDLREILCCLIRQESYSSYYCEAITNSKKFELSVVRKAIESQLAQM